MMLTIIAMRNVDDDDVDDDRCRGYMTMTMKITAKMMLAMTTIDDCD